ncbi:MAG: alpha/beta hydrolase [Candidatus Sumerlaeia bacterium]|nr:alpha/beta hydrolase [Candidatus Sumerlaeia bacterium]
MKTRLCLNLTRLLACVLIVFLQAGTVRVLAGPAAGAKAGPEQLQQLLKRFPQADLNGDGVLTPEEAKQARAKLAQKAAGKKKAAAADSENAIAPTFANVAYGPHERNVLDFYQAKSDKPTPLVIFIHGGGFVSGDKSKADPAIIRQCLDAGVSFMAINYRFRQHAPIQDILRDAARAVQFIRFHAAKYNIDPKRIASYGGSAGAGTSLWLAVHDDLADPKAADPVLRQSTRLTCCGCLNGQATYDMTKWASEIGPFKPEWQRAPNEMHAFYGFKSEEELKSDAGRKILADCDMLGLITPDDPPIFMSCSIPNVEPTERGQYVHHPKHVLAVQKRCEATGVRFVGVLAGEDAKAGTVRKDNLIDFLFRHLGVQRPAGKAAN